MKSIRSSISLALVLFLSFAACNSNPETATIDPEKDFAAYEASINAWHQEREAKLKAEDGWLALAGLFWLNEGKNTFGSAADNDLVFPEGKIAAQAGTFILSKGEVTMQVYNKAAILVNDKQVTEAVVFERGTKDVPEMKYGSLKWYVIKRGNKYGIRLRDIESDARLNFKGIPRYPLKTDWRVEAKLESGIFPKKIAITNVLGQTAPEESPGTLVFTLDGKEHRLDALGEGNSFFVIFGDKTNGTETYGAGRYLYADKPGADGKIILDFNKATNPPCAFVPYATCPLPPRQNFLTISVPAGEKSYEEVH